MSRPMRSIKFSIDRRRLPPINALTAFEAAARLGSFASAAVELSLTAGAVSKQIKALEDHLGLALFERTRQRVRLTEEGAFLAGQVRLTLGRLLTVSDQASQLRAGTQKLRLGVLPLVAERWLIPRLPDFIARHPNITINIVSVGVGFEFDTDALDAAIHTDTKAWTDTVAYRMGSEDLVAVATPAWLERHGVNSAQDLPDKTLLVQANRPHLWTQYFQQNAVDVTHLPRQFEFSLFGLVFAAVLNSIGVALVPRLMAQRELLDGTLKEVPGRPLVVVAGFFLAHPAHRAAYPPLQHFRDWALEQISADQAAARSAEA